MGNFARIRLLLILAKFRNNSLYTLCCQVTNLQSKKVHGDGGGDDQFRRKNDEEDIVRKTHLIYTKIFLHTRRLHFTHCVCEKSFHCCECDVAASSCCANSTHPRISFLFFLPPLVGRETQQCEAKEKIQIECTEHIDICVVGSRSNQHHSHRMRNGTTPHSFKEFGVEHFLAKEKIQIECTDEHT